MIDGSLNILGQDKDKDISYVCSDCGNKYSQGWPDNHICTWHNNNCDVCGKFTSVCGKRAWIKFDYKPDKESE